jgi:DnaJ family protein C protein 7
MEPGNKEVHKLIDECKRDEQKAKKKDYYKILGLTNKATPDEIKKAYRKLAPKYHPDKNNETPESRKNAEKMFREVSEAYQVLSDPQKRQMVDSGMNPDDPGFGI